MHSFTHSLQLYNGCTFGHGCGVYCYVPFLPVHQHRSEGHKWGDYAWHKENIPDLLREELKRYRQPARAFYQHLTGIMESEKIGWSDDGFNGLPSVVDEQQLSLF